MDFKFIDANEKYVASVMLYAKDSGDTYLYTDSGKTTTIGHDDLLNLCEKDLVLVNFGGSVYSPILYKDASSTVTITIATVSTSAFAVKTFTSKEPA